MLVLRGGDAFVVGLCERIDDSIGHLPPTRTKNTHAHAPQSTAAAAAQDEEFLRALHNTLFDVHVMEGALVCPETGRRFPINGGVPNMMLEDAELS